MGDERSREGNGAVVAIVVVLGIFVFLGLIVVVGGGAYFFARSAPPVAAPVAVTTSIAPASAASAMATDSEDLSPESGEARLPTGDSLRIEVDAEDHILVSGEVKSLAELQALFKDIKNGNSLFTKITIKFAGSSDAKTKEVALVLKEACIFYDVDPAGKIPAELAELQ